MDRAKPFDIPKREVWEAYKRVKANQGAAGVDGESIESFEADQSNTLYKLWNRCRRAVIIRHRFVGLIYRKGTDEERGHWKVRCSKPPGRVLFNMLSAVNANGRFRFMTVEGSVNASVFREFLKRLIVGMDRKLFLIVDGHPAHKAKLVRRFVTDQSDRIELFFCPRTLRN